MKRQKTARKPHKLKGVDSRSKNYQKTFTEIVFSEYVLGTAEDLRNFEGDYLIKLKYTKLQIVVETIGLLILIGTIAFICIRGKQLPPQIPGHYNAMGKMIDGEVKVK